MRGGRLRERVQIQVDDGAASGLASHVPNWSTLDTVSARVQQLTGRELVAAQATAAETTYQVTIRYYAALTTKHRLVWGSVTLDITGIIPDERRTEQQVLCRQVT